jgi:hypothetical protein
MKRRVFKNLQVICALIVSVIWLSIGCNSDNGTSSEFASVSGTITFDNVALWPDSGEVQVTIWPQGVWTQCGPTGPPQNPNNPLVLTKVTAQTQYSYIIDGLPEGEYSAIAVGWRHPNENLPAERRTAVLGVYINNLNTASTGLNCPPNIPLQDLLPIVITLRKGENRNGLNIRADFAKIQLFFR